MTRRHGGRGACEGAALDLLLLQELPRVGTLTMRRLLDRFGTAERALVAPFSDFAAVAGAAAARARTDPVRRESARRALARAADLGARVETCEGDGYPDLLRRLADPPPVLFLRGREELLGRAPMVTVVGARRATARGRGVAERVGIALARVGVPVVSGMALGIDGAAHVGAIRAAGDTVAVLGCGIDVAYPRAHRRLFERIASQGLLVTEFPPGTRAAPHHFPRRNRILAALSTSTVVVEAGHRSGSRLTVDHALDMGKDVWAVPGPIDASVCAGSNQFLIQGARPLISIDDFAETIIREHQERMGGAPAGSHATPADSRTDAADPRADTGTLEERVLDALAGDTLPIDEVAARFDISVSTALALLTTLELHGEIVRMPGMRFRKAA